MKTLQKIWSVIRGREISANTQYFYFNGDLYGRTPEGIVFVVLYGNDPI